MAQGFAIERFNPSERGSEWLASDSLDLRGSLRPAAGIVGDYAYRPLVLYNSDGSTHTALVRDQLIVHLGASLVVWNRVRVGFDLPLALWQQGDAGTASGFSYGAGDSAGLGDLRLGADIRLLGSYGDALTLAAGAQLFVPTGNQSVYLSDGSVRLQPRVQAAGELGAFAYAAGVGFMYRANDDPFGSSPRGSEVTFNAAAGLHLLDRKLLVGPEVYGSTVVTSSDAFFGKRQTPVEGVLEAHYSFASDWRAGLGGGPGLSRGLGEPALRLLASIEWAPSPRKEKIAPTTTFAPPSDRDHDGIFDSADACPDQAGPRSADATENGCPLPEDRDHDGVADADDACPDAAGPSSSEHTKNGCPIAVDSDADGIADDVDACPKEPGERNEDATKNGCPPRVVAVVANDQILPLGKIEFMTGSAKIDSGESSRRVLEGILSVLNQNSSIEKIRVEGHTDDSGNAAANKSLSAARAAAVVDWLVSAGIAPKRLTSVGMGSDRPLAGNDTPEGRQQNRRVELHIERTGDAK